MTMIITVPLFLSVAGIERYGVFSVAVAFLGYFGLFDLGVSRATARKIAAVRRAELASVATVMWTGLSVNIVFSIVGASLIAIGANLFFARGMLLSPELRDEANGLGYLLAILLPLTLLTGMFAGMLQGFEKFLRLNIVNVLGAFLTQTLPLAAAWFAAPTLEWLLTGLIAARVVALATLVLAVMTSVTGAALLARPEKAMAVELLKFGGWVSVSAVIGPFLSTIDRMAIGALLGPKAVATYAIPFGLVRRVDMLPMALASAIFPRLVGERDAEARRRLSSKAMVTLSAAVTPMIVCGGLVVQPFLAFWIDADFAREAAAVGIVLLFAFWAKSQTFIPFELLTARGRPDLIAKLHLSVVGPYLLTLAISLHFLGILGAACAWSLRAVVEYLLFYHVAERRVGLASRPPVVAPGLMISATACVSLLLPMDSWFRWIAAVILAIISLIWAWRAAPEDLRRRILIF